MSDIPAKKLPAKNLQITNQFYWLYIIYGNKYVQFKILKLKINFIFSI